MRESPPARTRIAARLRFLGEREQDRTAYRAAGAREAATGRTRMAAPVRSPAPKRERKEGRCAARRNRRSEANRRAMKSVSLMKALV
jgi:hypothetical protein